MAKTWWKNLSSRMREIYAETHFNCKPSELTDKQIIYIHFEELENV